MTHLLSSKTLVGLQFSSLFLLALPLYPTNPYLLWLNTLAFSLAIVLGLWTFVHHKIGSFNITPEIKENATLIQSGPYRYIRHPMYTAVILVGIAMLVSFALWKVAVFTLLVVILYTKAKREEGYWSEQNSDYKAYKEESEMFIPFIF
jgi:protein-S-isoprenylcysteine O-methyltransferase Ste14